MEASFKSYDIKLLAVNLLLYRIFTQIPMTLIKFAGSAAPLHSLLTGFAAVLLIFLSASVLSKYTRGNILDAVQSCFGALGRVISSVIFALYLILSRIFALSDFSRLISLIAFPTSPLWFTAGFLAVGGILGAMSRLRSIVRLHGVFMPVILIVFILLLISTLLSPASSVSIANPPRNINIDTNSVLSHISFYADIILLFLIVPTADSRRLMAKTVGYSGIAATLLTAVFLLAFALRIPSSIAQNGQFPVYLLMKEVYFGRFFQRLDAMLLLICAISAMLYLSLSLNLLTAVLQKGIRLPEKRLTPAILGAAIFVLSLNTQIFPKDSLINLVWLFGAGVLGILILTAIFTKVRGVINEKK